MILKFFRIRKFVVTGIIGFIVMILVLQYGVNAKYTFPEPHPFTGNYIYNPYKNLDPGKWKIANFHAHAWKPFEVKDRTLSSRNLDSLYNFLGYNIITISDYQSINQYENKNLWFIPVYEHGFQYYKNHQLILNAKHVDWHDFPFRQTLSNKQFILDNLKKDSDVLTTIVHPVYRKAYSSDDFKYLSNYNSLEIANHDRLFITLYDSILSAGHPVFLMADDDAHDPANIRDVCSSFNLINTELLKDSVSNSLRTGRSVGVKFNISSIINNEEKKAALQRLPRLKAVNLENDTLIVRLDKPVKEIKFIGQHGAVKKRITDCSTGSYNFEKQDTYIRAEIECNDGTVYFLNPVFRYDGIRLSDWSSSYNALKTWTWRLAFLIIFIVILGVLNKKPEPEM